MSKSQIGGFIINKRYYFTVVVVSIKWIAILLNGADIAKGFAQQLNFDHDSNGHALGPSNCKGSLYIIKLINLGELSKL